MDEFYHPQVKDLEEDSLVFLQHKYYPYLATTSGIIVPTLIAGFGWGDFMFVFFYCSDIVVEDSSLHLLSDQC